GAFLKPVESTPSNSEGDTRSIMLGDQEILKTTAAGARFSVSKRTSVVAANGGRVSFVGDLGLLGKTIVIDHGFGLATVYAHLSDIEVQSGATVSKGQAIAKTGSSGFALSEEVYFEVRLHGVPVSPNEWWDESWVTDHIENKLAFVRTEVVGGSSE
ncbi:MAG: M23 family metallopeptidase, partial [Proteobacteria bacterium]|nr:M23 family metallopeptidase [Pseudomonadota bacterium]